MRGRRNACDRRERRRKRGEEVGMAGVGEGGSSPRASATGVASGVGGVEGGHVARTAGRGDYVL